MIEIINLAIAIAPWALGFVLLAAFLGVLLELRAP